MLTKTVPKPGGKEETRYVYVPTGYSFLPYRGGLLDQPAFLVDAFALFMESERAVAMKQLSK